MSNNQEYLYHQILDLIARIQRDKQMSDGDVLIVLEFFKWKLMHQINSTR